MCSFGTKCARRFVQGASRGQHIVDQQYPPASEDCRSRDPKRTSNIFTSRRGRQRRLVLSWSNTLEPTGSVIDLQTPRNRGRQTLGLVVPASQSPPPVQRHGNHQIDTEGTKTLSVMARP
jgi:hypothetical protein